MRFSPRMTKPTRGAWKCSVRESASFVTHAIQDAWSRFRDRLEEGLEPLSLFAFRQEVSLQPYVIKQGDHLALLAYKFGFDADTVWNDPANAALRQLRPNPNVLWPTDILYIPDQNVPPAMKQLAPGTTNTFVSDVPTVPVCVKFVGDDPTTYASKAYTISELPALTGLVTDANGVVTFEAPVKLDTATVVFTDTGESRALLVGGIDPVETLSGIFQRLQNLGFISAGIAFDATQLELIRGGLDSMKAAQPAAPDSSPASAPSSPPSSGPVASAPGVTPAEPPAVGAGPALDAPGPPESDSPPPSAPTSPPSSPPPSAPPPSAPASSPSSSPPSAASPPSEPPSGPPPSTPPASSPDNGPVSSAPASIPVPADDAGLADDGTLSAEMKALLIQLHGY